jgi:hypothetical protein
MMQHGFAPLSQAKTEAELKEHINSLKLKPLTEDHMKLLNLIQSLVSSPVSKYVAI